MAFMALATGRDNGCRVLANLFTFFVAYQALTLTAFLWRTAVTRTRAWRARISGDICWRRRWACSLPAMIWTYALTGALDFRPGVFLAKKPMR